MRWADANPLAFLRLLTRSRAISVLAVATTLCHCTEGKVTADLKALWVQDVGLSLPTQGHFLSYSLALGAFGGSLGAKLIAVIGRRGFTTVACLSSAIGHMLVSVPTGWSQWLGFLLQVIAHYFRFNCFDLVVQLIFHLCCFMTIIISIVRGIQGPGINANNGAALKAICGQLAVESGMGRGEYQACMASMRSIVIATVPMLYGRLYGFQKQRGEAARWAWWAVAMLGAVLPELLHRTLRDGDLRGRAAAEKAKE